MKQAQKGHSDSGVVGMTASRPEDCGGQFRKGRAKTGGRRKGTPNRATRAVKEFLSEILDRADVHDAIRNRILKGDTNAFFKAIEIVQEGPSGGGRQSGSRRPPGDSLAGQLVTRLENGRKRVTDARGGQEDA
jgi:hypothetical protein